MVWLGHTREGIMKTLLWRCGQVPQEENRIHLTTTSSYSWPPQSRQARRGHEQGFLSLSCVSGYMQML